jgi:hypothetical protein
MLLHSGMLGFLQKYVFNELCSKYIMYVLDGAQFIIEEQIISCLLIGIPVS